MRDFNRTELRRKAMDALSPSRGRAGRFTLIYIKRQNPNEVEVFGDASPRLMAAMMHAILREHQTVAQEFARLAGYVPKEEAEPNERAAHLDIDGMGLGGMPGEPEPIVEV